MLSKASYMGTLQGQGKVLFVNTFECARCTYGGILDKSCKKRNGGFKRKSNLQVHSTFHCRRKPTCDILYLSQWQKECAWQAIHISRSIHQQGIFPHIHRAMLVGVYVGGRGGDGVWNDQTEHIFCCWKLNTPIISVGEKVKQIIAFNSRKQSNINTPNSTRPKNLFKLNSLN